MRKAEFLRELEETLAGEVSAAVLQENLRYYDQYISQEAASGRSEEDVIEEIGSPRLIARTIIDSSEAAGDRPESGGYYSGTSGGSYSGGGSYQGSYTDPDSQNTRQSFHYVDLNKWYWKLLALIAVVLVMLAAITVLGGIFSLLMRFAGPIILIWMIYTLIRSMRR